VIPRLALISIVLLVTACVQPLQPPPIASLLVSLQSGLLIPHRAVWRLEADKSWVELVPSPSGEQSEAAKMALQAFEDHRVACRSLCDEAFDRLSALPGGLRMAGTPEAAKARHRRILVPDARLAAAVQRPNRRSANLIVSVGDGNWWEIQQSSSSNRDLHFAWSGDGQRLAFIDVQFPSGYGLSQSSSSVRLVDPTNGHQITTYEVPYRVQDLAWSPDGRALALLAFDVEVRPRKTFPPRPAHEACDVYVVTLDVATGGQVAHLLVRSLADPTGEILWDPRSVKAPPWPADED